MGSRRSVTLPPMHDRNPAGEGSPTGRTRARVLVSGRVQGVFFRDGVRRKAGELNLNGWVRNLPDGRVEGLFEGEPDAVEAMLRWCAEGPPDARVEDVAVGREPAPDEPLGGFEVR